MGVTTSSLNGVIEIRPDDLQNGDLLFFSPQKLNPTSPQFFIAEKRGTLWNSVGIVLCLPLMQHKKYILEVSDGFPEDDDLICIMNRTTVASGARIVPLSDRLLKLQPDSLCALRTLNSPLRRVEALRSAQQSDMLNAISKVLREKASEANDAGRVICWAQKALGIIVNSNCRLSTSNLSGSYLNKQVKAGLSYNALSVHTIAT